MKKILTMVVASLLLAGSAYAVVVQTKTLTSTKIDKVEFTFRYNRTTGNLEGVELRGRAFIFDDAGNRAGAHVVKADGS